jgi:predicted DCC family thiol-disulfide oxidoreductase YuxK
MNAQPHLTLLYDAACPICALEMDHLRSRNRAGRLAFVDISAPEFDAARYGTTAQALDAEIHALLPDGSLLRGLPVLRRAYAAVGLGWVLAPTGLAWLQPLSDIGYRWFARHRRRLSAWAAPAIAVLHEHRARQSSRQMADCHAGACTPRDPDRSRS